MIWEAWDWARQIRAAEEWAKARKPGKLPIIPRNLGKSRPEDHQKGQQ